MPSGITMLVIAEPKKALCPIAVTEAGISMLVSEAVSLNALEPICVTLS
jgi:hypothetical protein